jgi:hypothetical protein
MSSADRVTMRAPEHRTMNYQQSGTRAITRTAPARPNPSSASSSTAHRGAAPTSARPSGTSQATTRGAASLNAINRGPAGQSVPNWSRPRGNRPIVGAAVARASLGTTLPGGGFYYNPFLLWGPYGGYGYFNSADFLFYDPYADFGMAYGLGMGWYPYYYNPYGFGDPFGMGGEMGGMGGGGGVSSWDSTPSNQSHAGEGFIRLKVKPANAQVFVDGYLVGTVSEFDGATQHLSLTPGVHHIEVKADGFEPDPFDVTVIGGQTLTFEGDLKKVQ